MDLKKTAFIVIIVSLLLAVLIAGNYLSLSGGMPAPQQNNKTVVDLSGRTVSVPVTVNRVACLVGPSYEKVFLLGESSKMAVVAPNALTMPWAVRVIPNLTKIPVMTSNQDPNIEELMKQNVDVVFFWDYPKPLDKMTGSGIPVVVTQLTLAGSQQPQRQPTSSGIP